MSELERGGRAGSPVGLTAPWWDFVWGTEGAGGGVRCDQWVGGGETPISHLDQLLRSQRHPWICSILAGVPVPVGVPVSQGRPRPPLHLAKREKRRSWGRPARGKRVSSSYRGPRTSSPMCGVWGVTMVPKDIHIPIPDLRLCPSQGKRGHADGIKLQILRQKVVPDCREDPL